MTSRFESFTSLELLELANGIQWSRETDEELDRRRSILLEDEIDSELRKRALNPLEGYFHLSNQIVGPE